MDKREKHSINIDKNCLKDNNNLSKCAAIDFIELARQSNIVC